MERSHCYDSRLVDNTSYTVMQQQQRHVLEGRISTIVGLPSAQSTACEGARAGRWEIARERSMCAHAQGRRRVGDAPGSRCDLNHPRDAVNPLRGVWRLILLLL